MTRSASHGVPRPSADPAAKRAAKLADRIVEDVMRLGWPVGQVLGSESELLERYQVSRAVFREAVRLVEHQQVARTRRGPGGGLVVIEPTMSAVIEAVVLYLHRVDATVDEVFEARIILEGIACRLASERRDEKDLEALRPFAQRDSIQSLHDPRELHALIAEISRNAGLQLFVEVFNRVAMLYSPDWQRLGPDVEKESVQTHAAIAEAVMGGEGALARIRMHEHLLAEGELFRRRRSTRRLLPESVVLSQGLRGKGAEVVARHITGFIEAEGLQPGDLVGTEPELTAREGVSRALLREAVRLLEHHHIARMRRGPGGGLFVLAPSADAVTHTAAIYLARHGMRLTELAEMRTNLEVALAGLAAERIDNGARAALREALADENHAVGGECVRAGDDLHVVVAAAAQNRGLELVALVLIRLSRLYQTQRLAPKAQGQIRAEDHRAHQGIAAAVESGDGELARQRMRRHLEALDALMR